MDWKGNSMGGAKRIPAIVSIVLLLCAVQLLTACGRAETGQTVATEGYSVTDITGRRSEERRVGKEC